MYTNEVVMCNKIQVFKCLLDGSFKLMNTEVTQ